MDQFIIHLTWSASEIDCTLECLSHVSFISLFEANRTECQERSLARRERRQPSQRFSERRAKRRRSARRATPSTSTRWWSRSPWYRHLQQGHVHHELVCQRHLREDCHRGVSSGPLQQEAHHYQPGGPDGRDILAWIHFLRFLVHSIDESRQTKLWAEKCIIFYCGICISSLKVHTL